MKLRDCTPEDLADAWESVKKARPLVLHITNGVAAALQANACLAVGASPLMSQYPEEIEELLVLSRGFLVNLGTPTETAWEAVKRGMTEIDPQKCFTLLDPVGYGASSFRVESSETLLEEYSFSVVKGNAGEISLLAGVGGATKGVDVLLAGDLEKGVVELAQKHGTLVVATGEVDNVSDGGNLVRVRGGSGMLPLISGSGCVAGTVVLSVIAACGEVSLGTLCGLLAMGMASERAEGAGEKRAGPGTFAARLLDELHGLSCDDFRHAGCRGRWNVD